MTWLSYFLMIIAIFAVCKCYQLSERINKEREEHNKQIKNLTWKYDSNLKLARKTYKEKISLLSKQISKEEGDINGFN